MRRREKFVLSSIFLSLGLLAIQYVPLTWRYGAVAGLGLVTFFISAWALSDDLEKYEWLTIIPLPSLYSLSVGFFYFLLPVNLLSRLAVLILFSLGMYALYLTANIYSVAKGRTIQLLRAAHSIGLLFTILTSLLFLNTIFSLKLPWYSTVALTGLSHFPLVFLSLWSIELSAQISKRLWTLTLIFGSFLMELTLVFCFLAFSIWYSALFIMTFLYIGLGILHNYLQGKLFNNALYEYLAVLFLIAIIFIFSFPLK